MGDVLSLVEKAEQLVSRDDAVRLEQKIKRNDFTLQDMRDQLSTVKRMGPLDRLVEMMPGMGQMASKLSGEADLGALRKTVAIIDSMTSHERSHHQVIDGNRRRRIAAGSGTTVQDVNRLLKQFLDMRRMLRTVGAAAGSRKKKRGRRRLPPGMRLPVQ